MEIWLTLIEKLKHIQNSENMEYHKAALAPVFFGYMEETAKPIYEGNKDVEATRKLIFEMERTG